MPEPVPQWRLDFEKWLGKQRKLIPIGVLLTPQIMELLVAAYHEGHNAGRESIKPKCSICGQTFAAGKHFMMDGVNYHEFTVERD